MLASALFGLFTFCMANADTVNSMLTESVFRYFPSQTPIDYNQPDSFPTIPGLYERCIGQQRMLTTESGCFRSNHPGCHLLFAPSATQCPKGIRCSAYPRRAIFDIDNIADSTCPLPHTLPDAVQFAEQAGQLGIGNDTWVIVYDNNHFFASARAWWMFRVFGHDKVSVLDGGLTRWQQLRFPVSSDFSRPSPKRFEAVFRPELFADLDQMKLIQQRGSKQILDARSEDSFNGRRPLHDAGLLPGHIPGSLTIPYRRLFAPDDFTLLPDERLRRIFFDAGVDLTKPIVTSCGSGVSAALLLLALYRIGLTDIPMFDGSWAQWGRQADLPRQTLS